MNANKLIELLKNLKQDDILDFGEDVEGNPLFVIKNLNSDLSLLTIGNFDSSDIM